MEDIKKFGKVSIYKLGMFGYSKIEAREASFGFVKYAQYSNALSVNFKRPREKVSRGFVDGYDMSVVILDGWGHPDPANWLGKEDANGSAMSRHSSCDPAWKSEFSALMDAYIAEEKPVVLIDVRGKSAA